MAKRYRSGSVGLLVCATLLLSSAAFGQSGDKRPQPPTPGAKPGAPSPAPADKPKDASDQDKPKPPKVTGGYSWGGKKKQGQRKRRRYQRVKYDPNAAHATFPGFRMLPDGSSMVWVVLDKQVDVDVRRAKGRVTFVLKGAQVNTRNNTHPLVTTHFNTPLSRVRLVHQKDGAHLVLDLREAIEPAHQVVRGPRGMMVLKVRLPPATRSYRAPKIRAPQVGGSLPKGGGQPRQ